VSAGVTATGCALREGFVEEEAGLHGEGCVEEEEGLHGEGCVGQVQPRGV
jgi:hypothetical protein